MFGILVARFGILQKPINLKLDRISDVVLECCALHNFLRATSPNSYTPTDSFDQEIDGNITPGLRMDRQSNLQKTRKGGKGNTAKVVRDRFVQYFNGNGKVSWQDEYV